MLYNQTNHSVLLRFTLSLLRIKGLLKMNKSVRMSVILKCIDLWISHLYDFCRGDKPTLL